MDTQFRKARLIRYISAFAFVKRNITNKIGNKFQLLQFILLYVLYTISNQ